MLGIVITSYNRPEYLAKCLDSLSKADIPEGTIIQIVDDASTDERTIELISKFNYPSCQVKRYVNGRNSKISYSLKKGFDRCFEAGCDAVMNLDSDTVVRHDFVIKLLSLLMIFPDRIITGFNCLTKNKDGSERHVIIQSFEGYSFKKSVTGTNMLLRERCYVKYMRPALEATIPHGNWDHLTGIASMRDNKPTVCIVPSVVQHIGLHSSLGHNEEPDVADDFVMEVSRQETGRQKLDLKNVTLVTINGDNIDGGLHAMAESEKGINFGSTKFLSPVEKVAHCGHIKIDPIHSVEDYSAFVMKKLVDYIDTDYVLIVQSDGYVKNPEAWSDEFLQYDYIGATWWYKDGMNVGNGGFSLRSKKLMNILKDDTFITNVHPEDHHICRTYRRYLERKYGIKFAPESIAKKFSVEGFKQNEKHWNGQFGFHGFRALNESDAPVFSVSRPIIQMDKTAADILVLNQPFGLGDHIFCQTIANDFLKLGYKVIMPVVPHYSGSNKHFPNVLFINMNYLKLDSERKDEYEIDGIRVIPLRHADGICKVPFSDCMKSKYMLFGMDWLRWREMTWVRDGAAENKLFYEVLGLKEGERYNLVNNVFGTHREGKINIHVGNSMKKIFLKNIPGYTLFDWGKVIENATAIHTVGTSINYLMELLTLKARELHLYIRRPVEKDFKNYDYILTKDYIFHR